MSIRILVIIRSVSMQWNCRTCDRPFADDRLFEACSERTGNGDCDSMKPHLRALPIHFFSARFEQYCTRCIGARTIPAAHVCHEITWNGKNALKCRFDFATHAFANSYNVHRAHNLRHGLSMIEWQIIYENFAVDRRRFHFVRQENDSDELMKCDHSCSAARKQYIVWLGTREKMGQPADRWMGGRTNSIRSRG